MALSQRSKVSLLALLSASLLVCCAVARDFSIVGYSPEHLTSIEKLMELFRSWRSEHGKIYNSLDEEMHRFKIFKDNLKYIDKRNKEISKYWLGLNEFADMSHEEFKSKFLGPEIIPKRKASPGKHIHRDEVGKNKLPSSVDWRTKGAVTSVKFAGRCKSAWAFSAVAAVEGLNKIVNGNLTSLSAQELVDCDKSSDGCKGGVINNAFEYIASNGVHKEDDYPYLKKDGTCQNLGENFEVVSISGYEDVEPYQQRRLLTALVSQPVSVGIDASGFDFIFYRGGIFYDDTCGDTLNHAVTAVGYNQTEGYTYDYIILKNSWGERWGEKGYMRIERNTGIEEGVCGIYKMASYPVVY